MDTSPVFDYTEVTFKGKHYKFLKEPSTESKKPQSNIRSKSVIDSPVLDPESLLSPLPPRDISSPVAVPVYDIERVKHFGELPSELYRVPHVQTLSPEEEKRVLRILKLQPNSVEEEHKRAIGETVRGQTMLDEVLKYFKDVKRFNLKEGHNAQRTIRLPKLRGTMANTRKKRGTSITQQKGDYLSDKL